MNMQKTGKYIAKLRKGKGWTQQRLAEQLSVSPQAVSKWECGEAVPDIDILDKISMIFDVKIDSIIKAQEFGNFVFEFGIGILPYIDMSKADNLIQRVSKYHEIAEFPKIRFKDNVELRDMQYRIILDDVIMADNSLEYVKEEMRIDEMLSYIKLYIN
ncbi:MAG: helix-turn-helix domain-containing protein [Lachnospiraceae bacterium]|nr:helix-turn-helix domain-containing protein [Lachnospiraceae bacterium]